MVAAESGRRFDPSGVECEIGISFQKRKRQNLTGAVSEEMPGGRCHRRTGSIFTLTFEKNILATVHNDSMS